ncbi:MAG: glycoside hydrolase family 3 C-terminal domain-containing protein [Proteiniphilum sp.]|jgi:beta-glucosidase|nr:glycoside hydrolase family 3 C-terminal domain-containing protein [Proteiniphilum sp.]
MKSVLFVLIIGCLCIILRPVAAQQLYKDPSAPVDDRVRDLLNRMTPEEKIGQLCFPMGWEMYVKTDERVVEPSALFRERMLTAPPGGFWATLRADPWTEKTLKTGLNPALAARALNGLQKYAVENSRLDIPFFFAEETMHGHMAIGTTVFPTGLGQGSTWNPALIRRAAEAIALETRLQGAHIGYGPVLDLARELRWSRVEETFGEDPVLTARLGVSFVQGMQGEDAGSGRHVYSTLKHFAAYGIPSGGHNGGAASIGLRELFSDHLMPFGKAVAAGAKTLMTSYNSIDGIPATAHRLLLRDTLRDGWGFDGFVFSDLGSIEGLASVHRTAPDVKHAAVMALQAGVDADLGGRAYGGNLKQALEEGLVSMEEIDRAVAAILRMKFEMGLFENPLVDPVEASRHVGSEAHGMLAREVARQGTVLLKNDGGVLPLSKETGSIAVIGPNADNIYNQLGDYTAPQERSRVVTVLDGIRKAVSPRTVVRYARGCAVRDTTRSDLEEAVRVARLSDVVVLVVGGSSARDFRTEYLGTGAATVASSGEVMLPDMESGEGYDRYSLDLTGDQERLLDALAATGKPLIAVYIQGRPLDMQAASERADALLTAWYPGQEGGHAVADILFGDYNPAGRLPVSVPRSAGRLPAYYSLGRPADYVEGSSLPLYAFGYGLSYTRFAYDDLSVETGADGVRISCTVANRGDRDGDEVVQLYVRDRVSSVVTPPIQLKDFRRITLRKGEAECVEFVLTLDDLALFDREWRRVTEPGEFSVMIGASSDDIRLKGVFRIDER